MNAVSARFPTEWYDQLLRTASFGSLKLGADELSVLAALGAAEDEGAPARSMRILAFASKHLQVTFGRGQVIHFGLYFRDERRPLIALPSLVLSGGTSPEDLRRWMRRKGVEHEDDQLTDGIRFNFASGLVAAFEGGRLDSLQVS